MEYLRSFYVAVTGNTAYVTSTLSDSLWRVDLTSGEIHAEQIPLSRPRFPPPPAHASSILDMKKYMTMIHTMEPPYVTEQGVLITYQNGAVFDAPEVFQGLRRRDGTWVQISDPMPAIASNARAVARVAGSGDSIRIHVERRP